MSIKRYNSSHRLRIYPHDVLIEVDLPEIDLNIVDKVQNGEDLADDKYCPAYAVKSVCDKSHYNPVSGLTSPALSAPRVPLYDTQNGQKPDIAINLGWLRSKARDVVEIDNAIKTLERAIESEKAIDMQKINELETKRADLDSLKAAISDNQSANTDTSTPQ